MQNIYKGMWVLFGVVLFALVDFRLPAHGFDWLQSSDWWQGAKVGVMYVLLPYLGLRLFEIVVVAHDHGRTNQPTNQVGHQPTAIQPYQPTEPNDQPTDPTVTVEPTNQPTMFPMPYSDVPEPAELSDEVKRSVYAFARWGSNNAAAAYLKKNPETIRKNIIKAREKYPDWVSTVLQDDHN